jgi:Uma2 family endonuclease
MGPGQQLRQLDRCTIREAAVILIYTLPMNQWSRASTLNLEPTGLETLSSAAYLHDAHRAWPGCAEGDFDYVDGYVVRHDWGDYAHSTLHTQLLDHLRRKESTLKIRALPSLTIQITPTRYRVPDIAVFDCDVSQDTPAVSTAPLLIVEVLSPEDTLMHIRELVADYLLLGVAKIWIVDPQKNDGWVCTVDSWNRATELEWIDGKTIRLADLVDD